jgi:hypothetical protein
MSLATARLLKSYLLVYQPLKLLVILFQVFPAYYYFVSEPIHPPPAFATDPPLEFSKGMSHEGLAEWLTNLLGDDYEQDIRKLRGTYICVCYSKSVSLSRVHA